jgi:glutamate carboxypeptidase
MTMAPLVRDAALFLSDKLDAMEAVLAPLVEVNSFTDNTDGGRNVGKLLREVFCISGIETRSVKSTRYADHLVFETISKVGGAPISLVGHLDTVFPPGVFEGYRRDGDLARGPGVLDMKGGLVVVAFALRALAETVGLENLPPIRVVIVSDEEVGSPEGQPVLRQALAGSSACLVFEAGRKADAIITRRKGTGAMTAVAHGKAAHAGANHKEGVNALWALAKFVDAVQALTDYDRGITVNVGVITGGQGKNTVPDRAEAQLDIRFVTVSDAEALVQSVHAAAVAASHAVPGSRIELSGGVSRFPMERTDASALLLQEYAAAATFAGLGAHEADLIGGGSDASTSSSMGIASIDGLGPRGIGFHTRDEQIEVSSLVPKAKALARFLACRGRAS